MTPREAKLQLAEVLAGFRFQPKGYIHWAYPWGQADTILETETGPDDWQDALAEDIGDALMRGPGVYRFAVASGHGIGKTAFLSMLIDWAAKCWPRVRGRVTANTDTQLRTTVWAEVAKWFNLAPPLIRSLYKWTATAVHLNEPGQDKNHRIDAIPWSEKNPAAFAGLHNYGSLILIIMDEAAIIPQIIWETIAGATTDKDTYIVWLAFGNPISNVGMFKEVMVGGQRSRWNTRRIDSRNVKRTNKAELAEWVAAYGEDSDFIRVRVKGEFPRVSSMQFIPEDLVNAAQTRTVGYVSHEAVVWGLDVARHGDDESVLAKRRGRDARSLPWRAWRIADTMQLAAEVAREWKETPPQDRPQAIFIDVTGIGWGVHDRLRELLPGVAIYAVQFGEAGGPAMMNGLVADTRYAVDRIWTDMREWLRGSAILPPGDTVTPADKIGQRLKADLVGREYGYDGEKIRLERKQDMKKRDGATSPDYADALACTFFMHVEPPNASLLPGSQIGIGGVPMAVTDYDIHRDL